ncbi:hypothetical protein AYI69_g4043 [Smittium culicis]|uniref:Uncharacterized protein n=1 Tax=Smittium culicis TaxID=133412 RepID=A0A1R1YHQ4_9FUNG|nr:hypothetical protein AYI69_g4043 [Smittium culicis]
MWTNNFLVPPRNFLLGILGESVKGAEGHWSRQYWDSYISCKWLRNDKSGAYRQNEYPYQPGLLFFLKFHSY